MIEGRRRNHGRKCGLVSFNPHVASSPSRIPLLHLLFKTIFDLRVFNPVPDSSTNAAENGQNKKTRKENQESGNRICKIESLNIDVGGKRKISKVEIVNANDSSKNGMVLPFQPLSLAFHHVNSTMLICQQ